MSNTTIYKMHRLTVLTHRSLGGLQAGKISVNKRTLGCKLAAALDRERHAELGALPRTAPADALPPVSACSCAASLGVFTGSPSAET